MRLVSRGLAALAVAVVGLGSAAGQEAPALARSELDKRVKAVALEVVLRGVELYNDGRHEECHRLYEGCVWTLKPLLDHRPELQKLLQDQLDEAAKLATASEKSFAIRKALDAALKIEPGKKPLWDRLGGEPAVKAVVREFLTEAAKDKKANIDRNGNYPLTKDRVERVERMLIEMVSSVTGGPLKYAGRDMRNTHAGMKITEDEFTAAAGHLVAALKKFNVPKAETDELIAIIASTAKDIIEVKK